MGDAGGKKRILIVDDDEIHLSFTETILSGEYDVITANSGKAALECLDCGAAPDLVLLDVMMPEMDGFEAYGKMRAIASMRDIPAVFLTSMNTPEDMQKALEVGATDYITKPYVMENFRNRIKNALNLHEHKRRNFSARP